MSDAFLRFFAELPLQGPGTDDETRRVLRSIKDDLPIDCAVADFGCGTGRSTFVLADELPSAAITAVDATEIFIDRLRQRADQLGLNERVRSIVCDMRTAPIAPKSLDLIWSEGAAYAAGFEAALQAWRPLLRDGGRCVLSECTWLSDQRPAAVVEYWRRSYPDMLDRDANVRRVQAAGFDVLGTQVLRDEGWDDYHDAIASGLADTPAGTLEPWFAPAMTKEIEITKEAGGCFGYVFYILRPN